MPGGGSIELGRIAGIRVGVDPSWFLVLFLITWSLTGYYRSLFPGRETTAFLLACASALLFFASVLLHELGHAAVARRNGIGILGVELWLFGGIARFDRDAPRAGVEFRVAAAGPLVTALVAAACFGAGALLTAPREMLHATFFERAALGELPALLAYLAFVNAALLVFNLLPAFPLDGGRILRALVWGLTGNRERATRFAAGLGRLLGLALIAFGVARLASGSLIAGAWLLFIGYFLYRAARDEALRARIGEPLAGMTVADVMDDEPVAIPATATVERAFEEFFLRYGWQWFPVVDTSGRLVGLVPRKAVDDVDFERRPSTRIEEVMAHARGDELEAISVPTDAPLERLFASNALARLGAVLAIDAQGYLRGVVTAEDLRRALRGLVAPALA